MSREKNLKLKLHRGWSSEQQSKVTVRAVSARKNKLLQGRSNTCTDSGTVDH